MSLQKTILALIGSTVLGLGVQGFTPSIFNLSQEEAGDLNASRYVFLDLPSIFRNLGQCQPVLLPRASEPEPELTWFETPEWSDAPQSMFPYWCLAYADSETGCVRFDGGLPEEWPSNLISLQKINILFYAGNGLNRWEKAALRGWHALNPSMQLLGVRPRARAS